MSLTEKNIILTCSLNEKHCGSSVVHVVRTLLVSCGFRWRQKKGNAAVHGQANNKRDLPGDHHQVHLTVTARCLPVSR